MPDKIRMGQDYQRMRKTGKQEKQNRLPNWVRKPVEISNGCSPPKCRSAACWICWGVSSNRHQIEFPPLNMTVQHTQITTGGNAFGYMAGIMTCPSGCSVAAFDVDPARAGSRLIATI